MLKRLLRRAAVQACLAALVGRYLAIALRTTRWTLHGAEHLAPQTQGQPAIVAFWHERLPLMPALWRYAQHGGPVAPTFVLVSRHADGRLIGELMRRFGVGIVHGSTARNGQDRGGAAGLRQLLERLAAGGNVVITPDGPRGPRRQAAAGVAQLAALSGVPVLPCAAQTSWRRTLGTWDRMVLPLPFGRGVLVCRPAIPVAREAAEAALPAIEAAMTEAAELADRLCP
jgi:lysophospholipid acyltransferase (LPLAT)-like uncharacterized protein